MEQRQRRQYVTMLLAALALANVLLAACGNRSQIRTIGIINLTSVLKGTVEDFKKGMTELGYTEGENINYIYDGATYSIETLDAVAQDLVEAKVDLILSITTPATQAVQRATLNTDLPVVFVPVTDPVGAGIVESLKRPGRNITGVTFGIQEGRRLEWLAHIVPTIKKVYIPYNPEDRSAVLALEMANSTAAKLGIDVITREAHNQKEVMDAIKSIPEEADAFFILPDSLFSTRLTELIEAANTRNLPTSGPSNPSLEAGALTVYGIWEEGAAKQAARLVHQIFQEVKPADLPVEMAEFYLGINLKTAEAIGLEIPDEILLQADIIIR